MADSAFAVRYVGPALTDGQMAVRDLAPALLAMGDLFAEASTIVFPDRPPVSLNIEATAEGSFAVQLVLEALGQGWDQISTVANSDAATAVVNLKELVVGSASGLFWLIKRLRGREVVEQAPAETPGHIQLKLDDHSVVTVPADTLKLHQNVIVRKHARKVIEPITRDGITAVEIQEDAEVSVRVEDIDAPAFNVPDMPTTDLIEREDEMVVQIAAPVLVGETMWRLFDGEATLTARMEDERFLKRVEDGAISFRNGDSMRCRVSVKQTQTGEKLKIERSVTEVIEMIPRPTQLSFSDRAPIEPSE